MLDYYSESGDECHWGIILQTGYIAGYLLGMRFDSEKTQACNAHVLGFVQRRKRPQA